MKYDILVILVTYNSHEDTWVCLDSIKENQGEYNVLSVIVDNNSQERFENKSSNTNIHIIRTTENIGFGRANNLGLSESLEKFDFSYVFILNNDTKITSNTLSKLVQVLKNDEYAISTCKTMYLYDPEVVWYGGGDIDLGTGKPKLSDFGKAATINGANKSREVNFASGCVMMFKKEIVERYGLFDSRFFMYSEDLELCLRYSSKDLKIFYTSKTIVLHKVHGSSNKSKKKYVSTSPKNPNLEFHFINIFRNRRLAMITHLKLNQRIIFEILFFLEFAYRNMIYLINGRFQVVTRSLKIYRNYNEA